MQRPNYPVERGAMPWLDDPEAPSPLGKPLRKAGGVPSACGGAKVSTARSLRRGGSGKTWTLCRACEGFADITMLTPTHQARSVLLGELEAAGLQKAKVLTVASFLNKAADRNSAPEHAFDVPFTGGSALQLPENALVVVDEAGMVGAEDIRLIIAANVQGLTILSGDPHQLPAVEGSSIWPLLMKSVQVGRAAYVELNENRRSQHADLTAFLNKLRASGDFPEGVFESVRFYRDYGAFTGKMFQMLRTQGVGNVVALAYRNATVDNLAETIREALGYPANSAAQDEVLRVAHPYKLLDWGTEYRRLMRSGGLSPDEAREKATQHVRDYTLNTGDLIRVKRISSRIQVSTSWLRTEAALQEAEVEVLTGRFAGQDFAISLAPISDWQGPTSPVRRLLDEAREVVAKAAKGDRTDPRAAALLDDNIGNPGGGRLWGKYFYALRERFCLTTGSSSLTVHKAQGSGRDHVFVNWRDLNGPEARELRYTAASRARRSLHIFIGEEF